MTFHSGGAGIQGFTKSETLKKRKTPRESSPDTKHNFKLHTTAGGNSQGDYIRSSALGILPLACLAGKAGITM